MLEKAPDLPTSAVDERFRFFEVTNVMLRYLGNGVNIRTEIPTDTNQLRLRRDFGKNGARQFVKTFNRFVLDLNCHPRKIAWHTLGRAASPDNGILRNLEQMQLANVLVGLGLSKKHCQ